jgi:hypothetical protein
MLFLPTEIIKAWQLVQNMAGGQPVLLAPKDEE